MENEKLLIAMAELIEAKDLDDEFSETVEMARMTAVFNPISETAEDLKEEMRKILEELD